MGSEAVEQDLTLYRVALVTGWKRLERQGAGVLGQLWWRVRHRVAVVWVRVSVLPLAAVVRLGMDG